GGLWGGEAELGGGRGPGRLRSQRQGAVENDERGERGREIPVAARERVPEARVAVGGNIDVRWRRRREGEPPELVAELVHPARDDVRPVGLLHPATERDDRVVRGYAGLRGEEVPRAAQVHRDGRVPVS